MTGAMEQTTQALRSLLIPFQGGRAIVPNSIVVQVLPFATPLRVENAPPWVVGAMLWRARTIPLVSLGRLIHEADAEPGGSAHARIVVVHTLGDDPNLPNFGILATDIPHLLNNLLRDDVVPDGSAMGALPEGILNRARIKGEAAIIPDLDAIEVVLRRIMTGR